MKKRFSIFHLLLQSRTLLCRAFSIKGFTLIELLVVISIIGILAALILARFGMAEKLARDTQRKSDLNQYRIALEGYASANGGLYPPDTVTTSNCLGESFCGEGPLASFLSACPLDPRHVKCIPDYPEHTYYYHTSSDNSKYLLYSWGGLEAIQKTWVVCWDGKVGLVDYEPETSIFENFRRVLAFCPL